VSGEPLFGKVTLIGIGLIGSSIARALRQVPLAGTVVAGDRSEAVVARVRELGIADEATTDMAAAVKDADLVIACVPVGAMGAVAEAIGPHLKPGAIVSDVGSTKGSIVAQMAPLAHEGFGAGTDKGAPTKAKAEIWTNAADFKAKMDKMVTETGKLGQMARTASLDDLKKQFGATGASCKACHDDYRAK